LFGGTETTRDAFRRSLRWGLPQNEDNWFTQETAGIDSLDKTTQGNTRQRL
jgi:hypothetical protein